MNLATSCHLLCTNLALFLPDLIIKPRVRMRIIEIPTVIQVRKLVVNRGMHGNAKVWVHN